MRSFMLLFRKRRSTTPFGHVQTPPTPPLPPGRGQNYYVDPRLVRNIYLNIGEAFASTYMTLLSFKVPLHSSLATLAPSILTVVVLEQTPVHSSYLKSKLFMLRYFSWWVMDLWSLCISNFLLN